jgi:TPR repeat protein
MKTINDQAWAALAAVLLLVPSTALGEGETASADPGWDAYATGDFELAHEYWLEDAYAGDPNAQFHVAYLYEAGKGVDVDYGAAFFWYEKSAAAECRISECNLANLYMDGRGVTPDHDEAIRRLVMCVRPGGTCTGNRSTKYEFVETRLIQYSDEGYAEAQYQLANLALGNGDFTGAASWLQKAAQQQHGLAQVALGDCYINGSGVPPDAERGAGLVFKAMVQHRENPDVLSSSKSTMALAHSAGRITTSDFLLNEYVWAYLALMDLEERDSVMGRMYETVLVGAKGNMSGFEFDEASALASRWSELFAAGLPGVTEEHLRTLRAPP